MTDTETHTGIDRILEQLRNQVAGYALEVGRFEALADSYWKQIQQLTEQRDRLQRALNEAGRRAEGLE